MKLFRRKAADLQQLLDSLPLEGEFIYDQDHEYIMVHPQTVPAKRKLGFTPVARQPSKNEVMYLMERHQ